MASKKSRKKSPLRGDKKDDDKESFAYKVLSVEKTKDFAELENADDLQMKMAEAMELGGNPVDMQEASVLDYYVSGFWWAKEQGFTLEQQSAFFTLLKTLLDNVKDRQLSLVDNTRELTKLFAGIENDLEISTGSLGCFNVAQAKDIFDYFHFSLFQHYTIYQFLFTHPRDEEVIGTNVSVETALCADMPWPPPLDEGVSEELHTMYIATPPPSPTPQAEEGQGDQGDEEIKSGEDGEETADSRSREADILAQLSAQEVESIMRSVFDEVLGGLETDVAQKLREKENGFINRINKIHKVAQS